MKIQIRNREECVEIFRKLVSTGNFNEAIELERFYYATYVKPTESISNWQFWDEKVYEIKKNVSDFGKKQSKITRKTINVNKNTIFIIYHNYSGLAHEQQILRPLQELSEAGKNYEIIIVYLFGDETVRKIAEKFWEKINVKIYFSQSSKYTEAFYEIEKLIKKYSPKTIIYPSIYFLASWAASLIDHNDQRFIVLKYLPKIVGNFSSWAGGLGKINHANELSNLKFFELPVRFIKNKIKKTNIENKEEIIFGSISRVEKINNEEYWKFIFKILKQNTRYKYVITCKENEYEKLDVKIKNNKQIYNLGWVEPSEVIGTFDLYIESFPWGGGDMSFLAISAGIPYVIMDTLEMNKVGPIDTIREIIKSDEKLKPYIAKDKENYYTIILELLNSKTLREDASKRWGEASKLYNSKGLDRWESFFNHEF
jgi:hypothetical protein